MKEFEYMVKCHASQEEIDDLLSCAFGGCPMQEWCDSVELLVEPTEKHSYLSEVPTRGGSLTIKVDEDENEYVLSIDNILKALGQYPIDFEDYDSHDASAVVQTAIFGEVVYG